MRNNIAIKVRVKLMKHISLLSGRYYSNKKTGNLLSIIQSDVDIVENVDTELMLSMVKNILTAFTALYFMIMINLNMFLWVLIFQLMIVMLQRVFTKKIHSMIEKIRQEYGEATNITSEYIFNIMNILISKSKIKFISDYMKLDRKIIDKKIKTDILITGNITSAMILNLLITLVIYGYGGYKIIEKQFTLGSLLAFQSYTGMMMGPCMSIVNANNRIQQAKVSIDRIYSVLDEEIEIKIKNNGKKIKDSIVNKIELKNVYFKYKDKIEDTGYSKDDKKSSENVLNGLNMKFKKGNTYAIVGGSGCGKSTIVNLLYRLWDVDNGEIYINNHRISEINLSNLRKNISIVSQETVIFSGTIKENILINKKTTDEELEKICKSVGLEEFINSLEEGINTEIGERGVKISGGQKQRISIARAILNDSSVLIFDEATSALDNISQNNIIENLKDYLKDKIVIMIAHRLSTIIDVDVIYVMKNGEVIEKGKHINLIKKDGYYSSLYRKR